VLEKMLAKDVIDRYQSWDEVLSDLTLVHTGRAPQLALTFRGASAMQRETGEFGGATAQRAGESPGEDSAAPIDLFGTSEPPRKSRFHLVAIAVVAAVALLGAITLFMISRGESPTDLPAVSTTPPNQLTLPPAAPAQAAAATEATKQLLEVMTFAHAHPDEQSQIADGLGKIVADFPSTPEAAQAQQMLNAIVAQQKQAAAEVEKQIRVASARLADASKVIERGLQYLASKQKADGGFEGRSGVDALVLSAFMANGHAPGREGRYRSVVENGIARVLKRQRADGYLGEGGGHMYAHGISTILLAELVGATRDDAARQALTRAVNVILQAQAVAKDSKHVGGWRYQPTSRDSDLSVTGWQLKALVAARDAGVEVPKPVIDKASSYVKRLADPEGGFGYTSRGSPPSTTAVGLVCLQVAGESDAPEAKKAADVLMRNKSSPWFYYTVYYGTSAMFQRGGKYWDDWSAWLENQLLPMQLADGSFPPVGSDAKQIGPVYATAMSLLALSVTLGPEQTLREAKLFAGTDVETYARLKERLEKISRDFQNSPQATQAQDALTALTTKFPQLAAEETARREAEAARLAEQKRRDEEARRLAEERAAREREAAARRVREEMAFIRAVPLFREHSKQLLAALARRDYAQAAKLAQLATKDRAFAPLGEYAEGCDDAVKRLAKLWAAFPAELARLKGRSFALQGTHGTLEEVSDGELVLEKSISAGAVAVVRVPIAKLTTDEVLTLMAACYPATDGEALMNAAWFSFAEGKNAQANAKLEAAQQAGVDTATARRLMMVLSQGPFEDDAARVLAQLRAQILSRQWSEARANLILLNGRYSTTKVAEAASKELAQLETDLSFNETLAAAPEGSVLRAFRGDVGRVRCMAFSADGRYALTGSEDGALKSWDVVAGKEARTFPGHDRAVNGIEFTRDARYAVSSSYSGLPKVWDVNTGREARTFEEDRDGRTWEFSSGNIRALALSPDGRHAVTATHNRLKLWDVNSGREVRAFEGRIFNINCIVFSPNGRHLLSASNHATFTLWDVASGQEARTFEGSASVGWSEGTIRVMFSPDGRFVLSANLNGVLKLWDAGTGREVRAFQGRPGNVLAMAFSPDGRFVLSGTSSGSIKLWEVATGREVASAQEAQGISAVAFSADARLALTASGNWENNTIKLWKLWDKTPDGQPLGGAPAKPQAIPVTVALPASPVATASPKAVSLFEGFGVQLRQLNDGVEVFSVRAGSSAAQLGLQARDIITHINERPVARFEDARDLLAKQEAGRLLRLRVLRRGDQLELPAPSSHDFRDRWR
jgi:WD40 repeat protein